jgi:hypothetical protein
MYPATFFGLFPPFPRDQRAFVAMSFDPRFNARWAKVLRPGIANVQVDGVALDPQRIDLKMSGDSVLTGILDEIGRCRVLVADVTSVGTHEGRTVRNENVFYEVGIAHAVRLPEEVVMFRSDRDALAFDISNVRVHHYEPDENPEAARRYLTDVLVGSLNELQLRRHLAIRRAAEALDADGFMVLGEAQSTAGCLAPERTTMGQALTAGPRLDAISRLLELTAISAEFLKVTPEHLATPDSQPLARYRSTPFGTALFEHVVDRMGFNDPAIRKDVERVVRAEIERRGGQS